LRSTTLSFASRANSTIRKAIDTYAPEGQLLHNPHRNSRGFPEELQKPPKHFPIVLPQLGNEIAEIYVVVHDALDSPPHTTSSCGGGFRRLVKKPRLGSEGIADQSQLVHRPESPAAWRWCWRCGVGYLGEHAPPWETRRENVRICPATVEILFSNGSVSHYCLEKKCGN
jgi:hypothetical protein